MIDHFERKGVKCIHLMDGDGTMIVSGSYHRIFSSVSAAHKAYYGYK